MPGTDTARRMLSKASTRADGEGGDTLFVPASRAHGLWTARGSKDREIGKMSVRVFRSAAKACTPKLGSYRAEMDALVLVDEAAPDCEPS
eukprot:482678-Pyramimonas_sp.AAC.1